MGTGIELDADFDVKLGIGKIGSKLDAILAELKLGYKELLAITVALDNPVSAAGTVSQRLWDVPDGKTFYLRRLLCWGSNHNPSSGGVYTNAAAWCGVYHGIGAPAQLADFWPLPEAANAQVIPYLTTYPEELVEFRQNDNIFFAGAGLQVGEFLHVSLFGDLVDLKLRRDHPMKSLQKK